jgi:hypothetical protein
MSPYSGSHRLGIAFAISIICAINLEISSGEKMHFEVIHPKR